MGDAAQGQVIWAQKPCSGCHGPEALGNIGPRLAGTSRTYEAVLNQVRTGKAPMPAFTPAQISDQEVAHIYAWLKSLPAAP
jgi:mono/diheme cytochrome c family protein